jgi:hypothetical protein
VFQLSKVWVDPEPGIDTIELRWTWSPLGGHADWDRVEESEVMRPVPGTAPTVRTVDVEIPRYVDGHDSYLFHYQFSRGGEHVGGFSPLFTETIVTREVDYVDRVGDLTEVRVAWSVGGSPAANWTQAVLDGLPHTGPGTPDPEQEGVSDEAIYELVQTIPLPRRYVAKVWGPVGATVEYSYQLLRINGPIEADDFERWDDNDGQRYRVELAAGADAPAVPLG